MKYKTGRLAAALAAVLIGGVIVFGVWQRANIAALLHAAQYSQEEVEASLSQSSQEIQQTIRAVAEVPVRDLTEEERRALREGAIAPEELVASLVGQPAQAETAAGPEQPGGDAASTAQPEQPAGSEPAPEQSAYQKELAAVLAKVYVLRESYTMALEEMEAAAKAEYGQSSQNVLALSLLAAKYLNKAQALEKECDRQMDAVIAELEQLVRENDGDLTLPQTVRDSYNQEKSLKKAWYLNKLKEKGLG